MTNSIEEQKREIKPLCKVCDVDYPKKSGILMGRDDLWKNGWHTHKRKGYEGHMVFKDADPIAEAVNATMSDKPYFPWEEGNKELTKDDDNS